MNEYLTTVVAAEHRRDLLTEAHANGLARIAREGHETWWQHLSALLAGTAGGRWPARRAGVNRPAHRLAH